ncbi:MAG: PD-(D/E)XK nuclease family protein, partial [Myxococcota bacterium]|nr:PD-(D/E)XK nuclease family protein [Myxococcota bacterium]
SSVEKLLGCSLAWTLHYPGQLRGGVGTAPGAPSPLLFGNLAHHVLAATFADGAIDAPAAAARAAAVFEAEVPGLAEQLLLPEHQVERALAKRSIVDSARELAAVIARAGATVRGVELALTGTFGTLAVEGRADLLLANPDLVIDFKWGATKYRERIRDGAALQLAIYAALGKTGSVLPGVAYLSLRTQDVLAAHGTAIVDARVPGTHSIGDMVDGGLAGLAARLDQLAAGELVAPSALEDAPRSALASGVMQLAPDCQYCDFSVLCGKRVRS